jgi:hypothetical protein
MVSNKLAYILGSLPQEVGIGSPRRFRQRQTKKLANPKNRSASTKGWVVCLLKGNGSCLLVSVVEGKMAAAPAVGTDGSAAAAVDHGCLLVIVWL